MRLLNVDMKKDLPVCMKNHANPSVNLSSVSDIIAYNETNVLLHIPYGQKLFEGIAKDNGTAAYLERIKYTLKF